ncbi:unnamed protein product [Spodoptera exigua]|nr:unnamed protein product [Spodoptera exigua]
MDEPPEELSRTPNKERIPILSLRLVSVILLVAVLTMHVRSVRVFRWEQSVTGGVLVTYCLAMTGLAMCAGADIYDGKALQAYICSTGSALLLVNASAIWHRWRHSGELTHAVAELLLALGLPLRRHIMIKCRLRDVAASAHAAHEEEPRCGSKLVELFSIFTRLEPACVPPGPQGSDLCRRPHTPGLSRDHRVEREGLGASPLSAKLTALKEPCKEGDGVHEGAILLLTSQPLR